jgi:transposase
VPPLPDWASNSPTPALTTASAVEFRARLIAGAHEQILFDKVLEHLRTQGLLKARGRQRTDSTHVLGAIRNLNRLEFVIETMRHALNTLAVVAPDWIRTHVPADSRPAL